ncbi:MAG: pyruvate dehydrogenase (acetyl-transferring) E1 component subunit alpha [Bacteroidia bacterium]|nr:pyruvate dehydrogenase (acetyl-transferring) E1 component subunit alpha [Bacteroidia bacterium]
MSMLSEPSTSRPFDVHGKPGERTSAPATTGRRDLVDPALCRQWLRDMLMIREFENRCMQQYQDKKIGGFCHIYIGQEAIAVGCTAAVRPNDPIVTAYRDHGHALARGMAARHCMAEMFGKIGGCAKGKGGSMHMFDREHHLYGGHGIVGAQIPLGVGLAFACKYMDEVIDGRPNSRVALAFLGDGALNQGAIHEAMNLAGLLDIPCVIICENNGYSMGTSIHRGTTMGHDIISKAIGYGIDGYVVDGMDCLSVYHDMSAIVEKCRRESRPAFVDMRCYRFKGHSMSDPRKYRTPEEENQYASDDPIGRLKLHLEERGELPEAVLKEMQKEIRDEVREAIAWSEASPEPPMSELYHDVFVEPHGPFNGTSLPQMLQRKDLR